MGRILIIETPARPAHGLWRRGFLTLQLQVLIDVLVLGGAFFLAYLVRFDFSIPPKVWRAFYAQIPLVLLCQMAAATFFGIYRFVWRYVGLAELRSFLAACVSASVPLLVLHFGLPDSLYLWRVPISVILMDATFGFAGTLGLRVARRLVYERYERSSPARNGTGGNGNGTRKPVLLIGAGQAGVLAAKELSGRMGSGVEVKGFVDDDLQKKGMVIQETKVLGTTDDLQHLVRTLGIDHVIITIAKASRQEIRKILEKCESVPVKARIIPGIMEILEGRVSTSAVRDVDVEDLLGRDAVHLDSAGVVELLRGKVVMVTGAGGSIGSELVRQVALHEPSRLVLLERCEYALYQIHEEVSRRWPGKDACAVIGDVVDKERMREVFRVHRPDVVIHAAAHKHVPLMEFNCGEAVKNNILGTSVIGEMAGVFGTDLFVLISTDKAEKPSSVMGVTKRVAEMVVQALGKRFRTRYVAVRFGNVLGSAGSVVPLFREQIARGGPVTVTHPEMKRYFMTIPEATQLVLQAGALAAGGEIFILDMGEPVKIVDLARDMISLSGFRPGEDVEIQFIGPRPGEKLFEELGTTADKLGPTPHEKIFVGRIPEVPEERVRAAVSRLGELTRTSNEWALRSELARLVPEASLSMEAPLPTLREAAGR